MDGVAISEIICAVRYTVLYSGHCVVLAVAPPNHPGHDTHAHHSHQADDV